MASSFLFFRIVRDLAPGTGFRGRVPVHGRRADRCDSGGGLWLRRLADRCEDGTGEPGGAERDAWLSLEYLKCGSMG